MDKLICIQNENLINSKNRNYKKANEKPDVSKVMKLKHLLNDTGYVLSIPCQYLTISDIDSISKYITTGAIDLGNEKIYNYVYKEH